MAIEVTDEEYDAVIGLDTEERYTYFVKRICDAQELWTLRAEDGFVVMGDDGGNEFYPVWPAERYAAAYAGAGELPHAIPLAAWMERWLPGLELDGSGVAVFPIEEDSGAVVPIGELRSDIEVELQEVD